MSGEGYNGWSNYETWNVALWVDNDEWSNEQARAAAREAIDDAEGDEADARGPLADTLEGMFGQGAEDPWGECTVSGPSADMLGRAWAKVDWHEIAEHYLPDALAEWKADNVEAEEAL